MKSISATAAAALVATSLLSTANAVVPTNIYDCDEMPETCNHACYLIYCQGWTDILRHTTDATDQRVNRVASGQNNQPARHYRFYGLPNPGRDYAGRLRVTPDEFPFASAQEGGSWQGRTAHVQFTSRFESQIQAGRVADFWAGRPGGTAIPNGQQARLDPINWDTNIANWCNCKPANDPGLTPNPHYALCDQVRCATAGKQPIKDVARRKKVQPNNYIKYFLGSKVKFGFGKRDAATDEEEVVESREGSASSIAARAEAIVQSAVRRAQEAQEAQTRREAAPEAEPVAEEDA